MGRAAHRRSGRRDGSGQGGRGSTAPRGVIDAKHGGWRLGKGVGRDGACGTPMVGAVEPGVADEIGHGWR